MSKSGYSCLKWLKPHNAYLKQNYLKQDNVQLGIALGLLNKEKNLCGGDTTPRTPEAVRKQLNALELSRPKKVKGATKTQPLHFFAGLEKGLKNRKLMQDDATAGEKAEKRKLKESAWALSVYGIGKKDKKTVQAPQQPEIPQVWVKMNDGARMQVPKGEEAKWKKIYEDKQILK